MPYGAPDDPGTLMALVHNLPPGCVVSAFSIGRRQLPYVAMAALAGGNVRVGLEDNLFLSRGVPATNGQLVERAASILGRSDLVAGIAREDHDRVVFLGSGGLKAAAAESALKLLELTDGDVVATSETPLGFRHGPKAIVTAGKTLVVGYVNGARPASSYCTDMLTELQRDGRADVIAVGPGEVAGAPGLRCFAVATAGSPLSDSWAGVVFLLFAQMLGLFKSLHLGHRPDNPNPAGQINRVVQNVNIYAG